METYIWSKKQKKFIKINHEPSCIAMERGILKKEIMKKIKIQNSSNYTRQKGESDFGPSVAVPGQSLTITQILQRYTSGTLPEIQKPVFYDPDADFDNIPLRSLPEFDIVDVTIALAEAQVKNKYAAEVIAALNKKSEAKPSDTTSSKTPEVEPEAQKAKRSEANDADDKPKAIEK